MRNVTSSVIQKAVAAIFSGFLIYSCDIKNISREENSIMDNGWLLHQIWGEPIQLGSFPNGIPRLVFHPEGNLDVEAGCNLIKGSFFIGDDTFHIILDSFSKKTCNCAGEEEFLLALRATNSMMLGKEKLYLLRDTTLLLSFFPK